MNKLTNDQNKSIRDKVFVGGLDYSMRDIDLKDHFEQYGRIKDYQIIRDPVSRSSRGFGFVKFFDESIALKLIT
jgi:RNA recognition motif-containing protein